MEVMITAEDSIASFVEMIEKQYEFWKQLEKEFNQTSTSDIEIVDSKGITCEEIN